MLKRQLCEYKGPLLRAFFLIGISINHCRTLACDKREAFAQGSASEAKQSILAVHAVGLLRFARKTKEPP
jgi:hypothetical protein